MKVVWTLEALESLRTIYEFILPKSPQNVLKIFNGLLKLGDSLSNDFAVYSKDPIINKEQFRHITKWSFKIVYEIKGNTIVILEVFDNRQNLEKLENY